MGNVNEEFHGFYSIMYLTAYAYYTLQALYYFVGHFKSLWLHYHKTLMTPNKVPDGKDIILGLISYMNARHVYNYEAHGLFYAGM